MTARRAPRLFAVLHVRRATCALALSWVLVACTMEGDVRNRGTYAFLPDGDVPDTASRPLRKLLIVDEDATSATRLHYYFEGDLGPLGLGIQSLARVFLREGRYTYAFGTPLETFATTGNEGGAGGAPAEAREGSLVLDANGVAVSLEPLSAAELSRAGATRFTSSLENGPFTARGYFGVEQGAAPLQSFTLPDDGAEAEGPWTLTAEIAPSTVNVARADDRLEVTAEGVRAPDYFVVDLFQEIERVSFTQTLEAAVRLTIPVTARYSAAPALLSNAYPSLCWSADKPLFARVTQVARAYRESASGDVAVVHRLANEREVPTELWSDAIQPSIPGGFCSDFR